MRGFSHIKGIIMTECSVCFENVPDLENNIIKCKNRGCSATVCIDCMQSYINFSLIDNRIPKCPNIACGRYYVLSDVHRFPHLRGPYAKCCFNELLGKHGDKARKTVEIRANIETLRRVREAFINERFPIAIGYAASVIMPHKLRRLDKQLRDRIHEQTVNTNRICMNLTCNGSLNENLVCLSCDTAFCLECERRKDDRHVCASADIESVRAIKEMIHCPNCHLPIIRSDGCNNMRCASCGQHFLYATGEAGGSGADVTQIEPPKAKHLLSVIHQQILNELHLLPLMLEIERLEPTITDDKSLTNILINYYKNNQISTPQLELDLAFAFQKYIVRINTNKRYHQALSEIESHIINRTVSAPYLMQILTILTQPV